MLKIRNCEYRYSVVSSQGFKKEPYPQIAFAGRSNVGKSSLMNCIVGQRGLAKVSQTPGKTRAINYFLADESLMLVDLPGFGYAKVSKTMRESWGKLIEDYLTDNPKLRGVVHLVDSRHPPTDFDKDFNEWLNVHGMDYLVVLTKSDKLTRSLLAKSISLAKEGLVLTVGSEPLPFSVKTGLGKGELLRWIESMASR